MAELDLLGPLLTARRRLEDAGKVPAKYYESAQDAVYLSRELQDELDGRVSPLVIAWPQTVADAFENRMDVEGFIFPGETSGDEDLWSVWTANKMQAQSQMGHLDAVIRGASAVIVGPDAGLGVPAITVESTLGLSWKRDPATSRVTSAAKWWTGDDQTPWVTIFTPDTRVTYRQRAGEWVEDSRWWHGWGACPVVPLVNRPRMSRRDGVSELAPVIPIADAANKMATDMMVSGEFHATPRRWAFGLKKSDFVDGRTGNPKSTFSAVIGRLWATENPDAKVGQFPEADLRNFHETLRLLAQLVAQIAGLPPHYMAFTGENPASADAIRSAESQLVKRVERKLVYFGDAWEDVMRLVLLAQGRDEPRVRTLETSWRDPSTPTLAAKADAVMKLATARTPDGRAIVPLSSARRMMGFSDAQMRDMEVEDDAAAERAGGVLLGQVSAAIESGVSGAAS